MILEPAARCPSLGSIVVAPDAVDCTSNCCRLFLDSLEEIICRRRCCCCCCCCCTLTVGDLAPSARLRKPRVTSKSRDLLILWCARACLRKRLFFDWEDRARGGFMTRCRLCGFWDGGEACEDGDVYSLQARLAV